MTRGLFRVALFALVACAGACGREDIQLEAEAGAPDGAVLGGEDAGDVTVAQEASCASPTTTCRENGAECGAGSDCCTGRCEGHVCLDPGSCSGPGELCALRNACCSGRCDPVEGSLANKCAPYCLADGQPCTLASMCCSLGCNAGKCGAPLCARIGDTCAADGDCCSGHCDGSQCRIAATLCRPAGEICEGIKDVPPCCGGCDTNRGRCGFGPGPCLPRGAPCGANETCCHGACAANDAGVAVCDSACAADGASCITNDDCCGQRCAGSPARCQTSSTCAVVGAACTADPECCTGSCVGNKCGCAPGH